jgi:hypothetical protein
MSMNSQIAHSSQTAPIKEYRVMWTQVPNLETPRKREFEFITDPLRRTAKEAKAEEMA